MSHGYQPQTTYISKALYWTFFLGVFLGTVLGFSIRPLFYGDDDSPSGEQVATSTTVDEAASGAVESTPSPAPAGSAAEVPEIVPAPRPPASPDSAPSEPLSSAPFDPDVKGLWPARHLFVGIEGTKVSLDTLEWLNEFKPGGVLLAPSLDIYLSGVSAPSLKSTVLGSQPREVSSVGLDYIRNLRSGGVLPVATQSRAGAGKRSGRNHRPPRS